jgi:hypothetical protein
MSIIYAAVLEQKKLLGNLDAWLVKATEYAKAKSFDPNVLLVSRLAPDQFPLLRQIQAACDHAKFMASRLAGKEPPKHPDTEQTLDDARARIRTCIAHLESFKASDFDGAETRVIALAFLEGKVMSGADYMLESAQTNFFFHLTTAYAILRHNGVDLGKRDYIGSLTVRPA